MLKFITPAAWLFVLLTFGLGIATFVGNTSLTAYLLPCMSIMLALLVLRFVLLLNKERDSRAS